MKFNIKNIARTAGLFSLAALSLTACEDEPDKYEVAGGTPEVIYVCMPTNKDSLITSAFTNNRVVLIGNNLRSVTKLAFNDVEAVLNSSLITDHALFVTIPRTLPTTPTDKIYMTNKDGVVTEFPFTVDIAAPNLISMSCEFVKPGEVATINGDYLLSYESDPMVITMPDGQKVTEFESLSQTQVQFVVPEGCTKSGPISVTTKYGTTQSSKFEFNDNRGILFNFDDGLTQQGWHSREITSDDTSLDGNFVRLGNGSATMTEDGDWDDSNFAFEYWAGNWNGVALDDMGADEQGTPLYKLTDFSDFQNMAVKFELYVPTTAVWSAGALQVIFAGGDKVQLSSANNTFFRTSADGGKDLGRGIYRPWETTGTFNTDNQWITVTMPISEFTYNFDGTAASTSLTASDFASLTFFLIGGGVKGTDCTPILQIDNIRAVPYK